MSNVKDIYSCVVRVKKSRPLRLKSLTRNALSKFLSFLVIALGGSAIARRKTFTEACYGLWLVSRLYSKLLDLEYFFFFEKHSKLNKFHFRALTSFLGVQWFIGQKFIKTKLFLLKRHLIRQNLINYT